MSTTSVFLRINDLTKTVLVHTLLQEVPTVLAWLGTPKSSVHPVPHHDQRSALQLREISQTFDHIHFCVNRFFPVSTPFRSGPYLIEGRCQDLIALENDCMMKRCIQRMDGRNMLCINMFFHCSQLISNGKIHFESVLLRRSYLGLRSPYSATRTSGFVSPTPPLVPRASFPLLRRSLLRLHLRPQLFQHLAQLVLSLPLLRIFRNRGIRRCANTPILIARISVRQ